MPCKIAIVNSSSFGKVFHSHRLRLEKIGYVKDFSLPVDITQEELATKLLGFDYIIASVTPTFTEKFFRLQKDVKLIARHGIGYNNIDIDSATKNNVLVTIVSAFVEQEAVAENAVCLLMSAMRKISNSQLAVKNGKWTSRATFIGDEIKNKTVGIIGLGNIGSRVGGILKYGFGASIIAYDPYIKSDIKKKNIATLVELDTLLKTSDIITLNCNLTKETKSLLNKQKFALMKKGVYIVNTARGELIDELALISALENDVIKAYAADVVSFEPISNDHKLLKFKNVIITPHISAYTFECLEQMGDKVVSDIEKYHSKNWQEIKTIVNPKVLEAL